MVRRPAALLALAAFAYPVAVGVLPDGVSATASAVAGAFAVAVVALALTLVAREEPVGLMVFAAGGVLLAAALAGAGVGAAANGVEVLFAAAAGLLFAFAFALPAAVVAVPLLVAGISAVALLGAPGAPSPDDVDVLTLSLPAWGGGGFVGELSLLDATFLALFAAWSLRFALRPRIALPLLALALCGAAAIGVGAERTVPALPLLAAAFLLPGADRLRRTLRAE